MDIDITQIPLSAWCLIGVILIAVMAFTIQIVKRINLAVYTPEGRAGIKFWLMVYIFMISFAALVGANNTVGFPIANSLMVSYGMLTLVISIPLLRDSVRQSLARWFPPRQIVTEGPDTGQTFGYDPTSPVHMAAMIYVAGLVLSALLLFVIANSLPLQQQIEQRYSDAVNSANGLPTLYTLVYAALNIGTALLLYVYAVGATTRRTWGEAWQRLGLRRPTVRALVVGIGYGALWALVAYILLTIYQSFVPPTGIDQFEKVMRSKRSLDVLIPVLVTVVTAAITEETLFRGALLPVFGLWPTTVVFALLHVPNGGNVLTVLIIFGGAAGLGLIGQRISTTSSMFAHATYNILVVLLSLG